MPIDNPLSELTKHFQAASEITGRSFGVCETMGASMREVGFVNVVEKVFEVPFGAWPVDPRMKELGRWALLAFDIGLEGLAMATLTRVIGVSFRALPCYCGCTLGKKQANLSTFMRN